MDVAMEKEIDADMNTDTDTDIGTDTDMNMQTNIYKDMSTDMDMDMDKDTDMYTGTDTDTSMDTDHRLPSSTKHTVHYIQIARSLYEKANPENRPDDTSVCRIRSTHPGLLNFRPNPVLFSSQDGTVPE
jgi:hypothetical protein